MEMRFRLTRGMCSVAVLQLAACFASPRPTAQPREEEAQVAEAPPPVSFPQAEQWLPQLVNEWSSAQDDPPVTVLRAYIVDRDWQMERHEVTGVVVSRFVPVTLFLRLPDGQCIDAGCSLGQEEQRGTWGRPAVECERGWERVTCASVEVLRPSAAAAGPPPQQMRR